MINPIVNATNWFLGVWSCLPFSIRAFAGLAIAIFGISALLNILQNVR